MLTQAEREEVRRARASGESVASIAQRFDVDQSKIYRAIASDGPRLVTDEEQRRARAMRAEGLIYADIAAELNRPLTTTWRMVNG